MVTLTPVDYDPFVPATRMSSPHRLKVRLVTWLASRSVKLAMALLASKARLDPPSEASSPASQAASDEAFWKALDPVRKVDLLSAYWRSLAPTTGQKG